MNASDKTRASLEAIRSKPRYSLDDGRCRVALLYPGDCEARRRSAPVESRFLPVFQALAALGVQAEAAIYHDDFREEVRRQLAAVDGVLVWFNPIQDGRDRSMLDAMLREVADSGVFVSAHPDIILTLGTKEVLYTTRDIGWGSDTHVFRTLEEVHRELPGRLAAGARVLKQYRGHSGMGVWKVELAAPPAIGTEALVRARHAQRGCVEETIPLSEFLARCESYFAGEGRIIDQAYQPRLTEGMVRCYLVHDRVAGFGHQAINALYPAPPGAPPEAAPQPGPRLYHPPTLGPYQSLKRRLEEEWLPAVQQRFHIDTHQLPVLWDCDFLLGPKNESGEDTYVLCEINVSSVSPFPESAAMPVAEAALARAQEARRARR